MNRDKLILQLITDEGISLQPYRDSVGKLTIGIGRNLDDVGISQQEARDLLENDIARTYGDLTTALPWVQRLDDARQNVLLNMAFNLGTRGLLHFVNTLAFVRDGKYAEAADEMLESTWARQVGERAKRLSTVMKIGVLP